MAQMVKVEVEVLAAAEERAATTSYQTLGHI